MKKQKTWVEFIPEITVKPKKGDSPRIEIYLPFKEIGDDWTLFYNGTTPNKDIRLLDNDKLWVLTIKGRWWYYKNE